MLPDELFSPETQASYDEYMRKINEINYYFENRTSPAIDWFFKQATEAVHHELWLPASSCFLNGIETSLRVTLKLIDSRLDGRYVSELTDFEGIAVMSNSLLRKAKDASLPVQLLSFPGETDMLAKVAAGKKPEARIVTLRNSLCHGNILDYVLNVELDEDHTVRIFTSECLRDVTIELSGIAMKWAAGLHQYWIENELSPVDDLKTGMLATSTKPAIE